MGIFQRKARKNERTQEEEDAAAKRQRELLAATAESFRREQGLWHLVIFKDFLYDRHYTHINRMIRSANRLAVGHETILFSAGLRSIMLEFAPVSDRLCEIFSFPARFAFGHVRSLPNPRSVGEKVVKSREKLWLFCVSCGVQYRSWNVVFVLLMIQHKQRSGRSFTPSDDDFCTLPTYCSPDVPVLFQRSWQWLEAI